MPLSVTSKKLSANTELYVDVPQLSHHLCFQKADPPFYLIHFDHFLLRRHSFKRRRSCTTLTAVSQEVSHSSPSRRPKMRKLPSLPWTPPTSSVARSTSKRLVVDAHALPPLVATLALPRRDATVLLAATAAVVDTVVALLVAGTVTTDMAVCLLAATHPTHLATLTTATVLPPAADPSRRLLCVATPMIATDVDLPLLATTRPATATTCLHPLVVARAWTTRLATSLPAVLPATTRHPVDTVTCRHLLPVALEGTTIFHLPLLVQAVLVVDTMVLRVLVMTTLVRHPVVTDSPPTVLPSIMLY